MDTMREGFISTTTRLLDEDPRLAVVLAEISKDGFEGRCDGTPTV
ncbi:hypothetical protein GCM10020367_58420 [Streptomyces sannanensis]|uniref:Uncharacterized protein n=1 Tax=Streptomyces sannanensis TaxID=285536 RepID=A0ABP6SK46_9ACTN